MQRYTFPSSQLSSNQIPTLAILLYLESTSYFIQHPSSIETCIVISHSAVFPILQRKSDLVLRTTS